MPVRASLLSFLPVCKSPEVCLGGCGGGLARLGVSWLRANVEFVATKKGMAAALALADCSPARTEPSGALLPSLEDIREVSRRIALAVAAKAQEQGLAPATTAAELERQVAASWWEPRYPRLCLS